MAGKLGDANASSGTGTARSGAGSRWQFAEALARFAAAGGRVVLDTFFLYSETELRGLDADALDRYAEWLAFYYLVAEPLTNWDSVFAMQHK